MHPIDIWQTATLLMRHYGNEASFNAACRADVLLEKGDDIGFAVWVRILHAIEELERREPRAGERVN